MDNIFAFIKNIVSLYSLQIMTILSPLITIPYMTRVLPQAEWGYFSSLQALAVMLSVIIDYGFPFSAARLVAENRDDEYLQSTILSEVLLAKLGLTLPLILLSVSLYCAVENLQFSGWIFLWSIIFSISLSNPVMWFFIGREEVGRVAPFDVVARLLAVLCSLIFIKQSGDSWIYFASFAIFLALSNFIMSFIAIRSVGFAKPSLRGTINLLKEGWQMFIFRFLSSFYASANSFLLVTIVSPTHVAVYANADKLLSASKGILMPITQAFLPRLTNSIKRGRADGIKLLKLSLYILIISALIISSILYFSADWTVKVLFGEDYVGTSNLVRTMAPSVIFMALYNVFGVQWLIANRKDKIFNIIIFITSLTNILMIYFLVPHYSQDIMPYIYLLADILPAIISLCVFFCILRQNSKEKIK